MSEWGIGKGKERKGMRERERENNKERCCLLLPNDGCDGIGTRSNR